MRLYVGNLPFSATADDVLNLFRQAGTVVECNLIMDRTTERSKGFAFVEMSSDEEANRAITQFNGHDLGGRNLRVNEARPRGERSQGRFAMAGHGDGREAFRRL
jgi:RNA recognition motif-containing protein